MITTKIQVTPYVAEYISAKFFDEKLNAVHFPPNSDLYFWIYDLLQKRPVDHPVDEGNLEFVIPDRRLANTSGGKSPEQYNYISKRSADLLDKKMRTMMWAELHDKMDDDKHNSGMQYKESCYEFSLKYRIESISEDGLFKNYQRWKDVSRKKMSKYKKNVCKY